MTLTLQSEQTAKQPLDSPYITMQEAADYLRIPLQTLKNWRSQGRGPQALKLGALVRYRFQDIDEWAAAQLESVAR